LFPKNESDESSKVTDVASVSSPGGGATKEDLVGPAVLVPCPSPREEDGDKDQSDTDSICEGDGPNGTPSEVSSESSEDGLDIAELQMALGALSEKVKAHLDSALQKTTEGVASAVSAQLSDQSTRVEDGMRKLQTDLEKVIVGMAQRDQRDQRVESVLAEKAAVEAELEQSRTQVASLQREIQAQGRKSDMHKPSSSRGIGSQPRRSEREDRDGENSSRGHRHDPRGSHRKRRSKTTSRSVVKTILNL
jgi:hypothetical protein